MATLIFDGTTNSLSPTITARFTGAVGFYVEVPGVLYPNFVEFDFYLAAWVTATESRIVELTTSVVRTSEFYPLPEWLHASDLELQIGFTAETEIQLKVWIEESATSGSGVVDLTPLQTQLDEIETKIDALAIASTQLPADIAQLQRFSTYWFDAEDLASSGINTTISSWQDKNGLSVSGVNAAIIQVSNGKTVVYFPAGKSMHRPESQNDYNYVDAFIVLKSISNGYIACIGDYSAINTASTNQILGLYIPYSGGYLFQDQFTQQISGYSPTRWGSYGLWHIIHLRYQAGKQSSEVSDGYMYVTNNRPAHQYYQIPAISNGLQIGEMSGWGQWEGQLQKFIVFLSRDKFLLNETERDLIKSYLIEDMP